MTFDPRISGTPSPEAMNAYRAAYERAVGLGMPDDVARIAGIRAIERSRRGKKYNPNTDAADAVNTSRVETCDNAGRLKPEWRDVPHRKRSAL